MLRDDEAGGSGSNSRDKLETPKDLLQQLKNDPVKWALIRQLLDAEKTNFAAYTKKAKKTNKGKKADASPLLQVKKKTYCESPTAALRRKVCVQRNDTSSDNSSSEVSESTGDDGSRKVPFGELFKGVTAFVEVNRDGIDKSAGIKAIMRCMGAKICDKFSSELTHVVFKDGSLKTFQKAKLMKIHLVSVLWLDAVRKTGVRVPERNYPAFGGDYNEVSVLCSQLQKDYEEIVQDEKRRSLVVGPRPSRPDSNLNRRKTIMTPSTSFSSYATAPIKTPRASPLSEEDNEVAGILNQTAGDSSFLQMSSPEMTSDESDCGGVVDGHSSRHLKEKFLEMQAETRASQRGSSLNNSKSMVTFVDKVVDKGVKRFTIAAPTDIDITPDVSTDKSTNISDDAVEQHHLLTLPNSSKNHSTNTRRASRRSHVPNISSNKSRNVSQDDVVKNRLPNALDVATDKSTNISDNPIAENNCSTMSLHMDDRRTPGRSHVSNISTDKSIISENDVAKNRLSSVVEVSTDKSTNISCDDFRMIRAPNIPNIIRNDSTNIPVNNDVMNRDSNVGNVSTDNSTNISNENIVTNRRSNVANSTADKSNGSENDFRICRPSNVLNIVPDKLPRLSGGDINNARQVNLSMQSSTMSSLRLSAESKNKSQGSVGKRLSSNKENDGVSSLTMSSLQLSSENQEKPSGNSGAVVLLERIATENEKHSSPSQRSSPHKFVLPATVTRRRRRKTPPPSSLGSAVEDKTKSEGTDRPIRKSCRERRTSVRYSNYLGTDISCEEDNRNVTIRRSTSVPNILTEKKQPDTPRPNTKITSQQGPISITGRRSVRLSKTSSANKAAQEEAHTRGSTSASSINAKTSTTSNEKDAENLEKACEGAREVDNYNSQRKQDLNSLRRRTRALSISSTDCQSNVSVLAQSVTSSYITCGEDNGKRSKKKSPDSSRRKTGTSIQRELSIGVSISTIDKLSANNSAYDADCGSEKSNTFSSIPSEDNQSISKIIDSLGCERAGIRKALFSSNDDDSNDEIRSPAKKLKSRSAASPAKRMRKLFNPEDTTLDKRNSSLDETEREERRRLVKAKPTRTDGVIIMPNYVLTKNKASPKSSGVVCDTATKDCGMINSQPTKEKKKVTYREAIEEDTEEEEDCPITPIKRRSTLEFESLTQTQKSRKLKLEIMKRPSIVCTKFHRPETLNFQRIVDTLGRFQVENNVSEKTTHLVVGEVKRTINMLRAIARGCWILHHEWLLKSMEAERWLPEEDYEATEFSPAVQQCRLERHAFGPSYSMDIFQNCGPIFVSKCSVPKAADLRELVTICKGTLTTISRNAKIVVGENVRYDWVTCVREEWLLDCITFNRLCPLRKYLIQPSSTPIPLPHSPHF